MAFEIMHGVTSKFSNLNAWATVLVIVLCLLAWGANNAIVSMLAHVPAVVGAAADLSTSIDELSDELSRAPNSDDFRRLEAVMEEQAAASNAFSESLNEYQSNLGKIGPVVDEVRQNGHRQLKALEGIQSSFATFPETIFGLVESRYPTRESRERFNSMPYEPEGGGSVVR